MRSGCWSLLMERSFSIFKPIKMFYFYWLNASAYCYRKHFPLITKYFCLLVWYYIGLLIRKKKLCVCQRESVWAWDSIWSMTCKAGNPHHRTCRKHIKPSNYFTLVRTCFPVEGSCWKKAQKRNELFFAFMLSLKGLICWCLLSTWTHAEFVETKWDKQCMKTVFKAF